MDRNLPPTSSPRRRPASSSPRRPAPFPSPRRGSPRSAGPAPQRPATSDVATWTFQAGVEAPVAYSSSRPWRRQERARVGMLPERLFRPFQGRTVADLDRLAEGAALPLAPDTRLCGCGAVLLHPSHASGPLHLARTQEAGASATAPPPPPPGPSGAAKLMVERAAREPEFANWLLQVASTHASGQGPSVAPAAGLPPPPAAPVLPPVAPAAGPPPPVPAPDQPPVAAAASQPPGASLQPLPGQPGAPAQAPEGPPRPAALGDPAASGTESVQGLSLDELALLDAMLE